MSHFLHGFTDELAKIAKSSSDGMGSGQTAAVGAAAASPFVGMIGQEKIRHDPHKNKSILRFSSIDELARKAQPGDIIVTSKKRSIWKSVQSPFSGSEFYHAQPVIGRRGGRGTTADIGGFDDSFKQFSKKDFAKELDTITKGMKGGGYKDAVLLRPTKSMGKGQIKTFVNQSMDRARLSYDNSRAVKAGLKDIFVPKIVPKALLDKAKGITTIRYVMMKDYHTGKKARRPMMCKGNVCSTAPAQSFEKATGERIVRGKMSKDVMPADFLRSTKLSPVGAVVKETSKFSKLAPIASRAGLGVGLAAGVYGATERPDVAAGIAGAAGAAAAQSKYLDRKGKKMGLSEKEIRASKPRIIKAVNLARAAETPKAGRKILLSSLRKGLPARAVGAAAAYTIARSLMKGRKGSKT